MNGGKPLLHSKTFWVNLLLAAGAVASGAYGIPIPPKYAVPITAIANVGIRLLTDSPISGMFS